MRLVSTAATKNATYEGCRTGFRRSEVPMERGSPSFKLYILPVGFPAHDSLNYYEMKIAFFIVCGPPKLARSR